MTAAINLWFIISAGELFSVSALCPHLHISSSRVQRHAHAPLLMDVGEHLPPPCFRAIQEPVGFWAVHSLAGLFTAWLCCGIPHPLTCPHPAVAADVRLNPVDTLQLHLLPDMIPGLLVCSACCTLLTCLWLSDSSFVVFILSVHSGVDFPPAFVLDTLSSIYSVKVAYC